MNTYESKQKQLFVSQIEAYNKLSDLKNIEPYVSAIKQQFQDKIQDISIDSNYISLSVENINVVFKIIDREEYKTIKFAVDNIPLSANMWIQLKEISEMETRMKLTIKADIPFFLFLTRHSLSWELWPIHPNSSKGHLCFLCKGSC